MTDAEVRCKVDVGQRTLARLNAVTGGAKHGSFPHSIVHDSIAAELAAKKLRDLVLED
ncbi:MAG: hypothetical protein WCA45_11565 [Thiobacillaceae bacterium]